MTTARPRQSVPVLPNLFVWPSGAEGPTGIRAGKCPACGKVQFPFRARCVECRERAELVEVELSHHGVVFESTLVHVAAPGFVAPYRVGYVDLTDGVRIFTQLDAPAGEALEPGAAVQLRFRPFRESKDEVVMGFTFTPAEGRSE